MTIVHILIMPTYKPGDPEPDGYLQWHEWAEVQWKSGLRQQQCAVCDRWYFPQSLSDKVLRWEGKTIFGQVVQQSAPICKACEESEAIACEITR